MMKLTDLQQKLKELNIDAYLINHSNMFLHQDILDDENKILELTGFSGSNGLLIVMQKNAVLLVDGRYEIQARQEVTDKNIEVYCTKLYPTSTAVYPFIKGLISTLMYNPWCFAGGTIRHLGRSFPEMEIIEDKTGLLGKLTSSKIQNVFEHRIEFAGNPREEKIKILTDEMQKHSLKYYLLCDAASVSWMLNLRSDLLPDTPILRAYTLVSADGSYEIFGDNIKGVEAKSFAELETKLNNIGDVSVGIDTYSTPKKITSLLGRKAFAAENPIALAKSRKSQVEMHGFENSHLRDGVALTKFLCWLDHNWQEKTELDVCEKLYEFRSKQQHFFSLSFDTIAAFGTNAAIVHYSPTEATNKKLEEGNVLLLDSGAQYFDGTTDVTRTVPIGKIKNSDIIKHFTLVLKAHIAMASTIFPIGTKDNVLDCITRRELWRFGLEYKHGSGHGVGHFSGVHEMPPSLSEGGSGGFASDMVLSIEPGYYLENAYGIRIENLVKTVLLEEPPFDGKFLRFEALTLSPIDKRLVDKYLLNEDELQYFNDYNRTVLEKLAPFMDENELEWLKDICSPL